MAGETRGGFLQTRLRETRIFRDEHTYRLTPDWEFPAQKEDIVQTLRFMRENRESLNIDTSRIATFGYSAGGHFASLAGLDPEKRDEGDRRLLLGGPPKGREKAYREASPVTHVTQGSPPVFIYHGTADKLVPTGHPKAFMAALRE